VPLILLGSLLYAKNGSQLSVKAVFIGWDYIEFYLKTLKILQSKNSQSVKNQSG